MDSLSAKSGYHPEYKVCVVLSPKKIRLNNFEKVSVVIDHDQKPNFRCLDVLPRDFSKELVQD